jgi:hypothetical protein
VVNQVQTCPICRKRYVRLEQDNGVLIYVHADTTVGGKPIYVACRIKEGDVVRGVRFD